MTRRGWALGAVAAVLAGVAVWAVMARGDEAAGRPGLAVFTSLPLFWNEAPDIAAMLAPGGEAHWARTALEGAYTLRPRDALGGLKRERRLLMAQPRPLAPAENVALDAWVRRGGRLLLFADPALTQDSAFALGDRRRPQDTVLLSPILTRWGLSLAFDEDQPLGERVVALGAAQLPVNLPGQLRAAPGGSCRTSAAGLVARCRIGQGRVTVIADAALFERQTGPDAVEPRRRALLALAAEAFE